MVFLHDFIRIATELGIRRIDGVDGIKYARHPLVYIVEAADDICYEVMDIEDAHKLKILGTQQVIDLFIAYFSGDRKEEMLRNMERVDDPNEKIAYLRSCVIGTLVNRAAEVFIDNEQAILDGTFTGCLIDHIPSLELAAYNACVDLSYAKIYNSSQVVDIELAGNRIITFLLEKLVNAVLNPELNYSRLLLSRVPEQYEVHSPDLFCRLQAVVDHVSAMTDVYALDLYRKLNGLKLPAV